MINSVTVTNYLGESIKLELAYPEKSGLAVLGITGLGPCKADINAVEVANSDGSIYNSARVNSRNIVLSLKPLFNPTVEHSRQSTYKYFPIKKKIKLLIETDNRVCETYGYVESNDPSIFSSSQTIQISIMCPNPYFYSAGDNGTNITIFSGVISQFEFPFSNDSLTQDLIEFGIVQNKTTETVYYDGDAEVGILIFIHALGTVVNPTIYNCVTREVMRIDTTRLSTLTGHGIIAGDEIIISTIKGDKYITLLRDGEYINILNCINKNSDWFQLTKGDNLFTYTADYGVSDLQFRIENKIVYEGV